MKHIFNKIFIIKGDITKISVDVIVNAANTSLLGGGGVDGAIHRAGGKKILEECYKIKAMQGGCKVGNAVATSAGNLPAKYIFHAVGPVWQDGLHNENFILEKTYNTCFSLMKYYGLKSISFPNISTGRYNFPKKQAAEIALKSTCEFLISNDFVERVNFVCYDFENYNHYLNIVDGYRS
ncbi:macro domain-containing protein [Testudinibacter sp. P80/BLE/0925]|uniref:macro domain-containing protein n=1 Tax=Testudinibacter sp. TW-1 TaxID=3417757 RepID=UPI003D367F79